MSNETTNNNIFKQDITTINHDASSSEQNASMANLRKAVNFEGAIGAMQKHCDVIVEVSPHSVLRQYIEDSELEMPYISTLRRG